MRPVGAEWPLFANCVEKLRLIETAGADSLPLGAGVLISTES